MYKVLQSKFREERKGTGSRPKFKGNSP